MSAAPRSLNRMQQALPLGGDAPRVDVRRSRRRTRTMTAYRDGDAIVVLLPARMTRADEQRYVPELVAKVLRGERRRRAPRGDAELLARARRLAREVFGAESALSPASIRWVSNQGQRWGSCTPATGEIRLSARLQALPAWVVDYVIVHELAHLVEAHHNDRFWALVSRYDKAERARGYLDGYADARHLEPEDPDGEVAPPS